MSKLKFSGKLRPPHHMLYAIRHAKHAALVISDFSRNLRDAISVAQS